MQSNFTLINESKVFDIKEDSSFNLLEYSNQDQTISLTFNIHDNVNVMIKFSSINKSNVKSFEFNFNLNGENINCEAMLNCLALENSSTTILANGIGTNKNSSGYINIKINGILEGDRSDIIGIPKYILTNNKIDAHHSLLIGSLNEEEVFYLKSRGIDDKQAKYMLLTSKIFDCLNSLSEQEQIKYKNSILEIWGQ
ncbi:MAG: SufD family Fe-S cluster assembly protein [Mycoplasma sp.]